MRIMTYPVIERTSAPSVTVSARQGPIRLLYRWLLRLAAGPHATAILAVVAFLEASILPVPPDALLVPMILTRPKSAWRYAAIASAASVLGALLGYAIGRMFYDLIGRDIIAAYGLGHLMAGFQVAFARWGALIIILKGLTPIPFKLVTIASGAARFNLPKFLVACIIARSAHYFILAAVVTYWGPQAASLMERHLERIVILLLLLSGGTALCLFLSS
jgi:membrane protein YqaA with SNARE-associated domain